jgi:hypothetical protein
MPQYPKYVGWPDGENNVLRSDELPVTALRRSVNYDITDTGNLLRRRGSTKIYTATIEPGTLYSNGSRTLFVEAGNLFELVKMNGVWKTLLVRTGLGAHSVAYTSINDDIFYSNGVLTGKVTAEGLVKPWGIRGPVEQPNLFASDTGGTLVAGTYQVAVTFVADDGEESGTSLSKTVVVTADGGSITLRDIPSSVDASTVRVYCSEVNGEGLYRVGEFLNGVPSYRITQVSNAQDIRLQTQFGEVPPAGDVLEYHSGRIYIAQGNVVWYTEPLRYGLVKCATNFLMFPREVTVMKSVEDGIYICADQTYWISGIDTNDFQQRAVLPYGAVKGTGINIPKSDNVAWFSRYGFVIAGLEAQITNVQEEKSAVSEFENGAMIFREQRGLRQIIATMGTGTESSFLAPDYVTLETARRGSAI